MRTGLAGADGQGGVEHGAAGLRRLVGVAGQGFQLDAVVDEELAQLINDVRAVSRADIGYVGQSLRAGFQRGAAHHIDGESVFFSQCWQASLKARQRIPATCDFQDQCTALAVASQA